MTTRYRLALSIGACVILAACANPVGTSDGGRGALSSDPADYPPPVSVLVYGTSAQRQALERLQFAEADAAVASCMQEAGFGQAYIPARLFQGRPNHDFYPDPFTPPLPIDEARDTGWGIIDALLHPSPMPAEPQTPEQSAAYRDALDGCEPLRDSALVTEDPSENASKSLMDDVSGASQAVGDNAEARAAMAAYSECMEGRGYSGGPPYDQMFDIKEKAKTAIDDPAELQTLKVKEEDLAVADTECRSPVYGQFLHGRAEAEQPVISNHEDELKSIEAAWTEIVAEAPSRAEVAGEQ
jgi:hypothetical protein